MAPAGQWAVIREGRSHKVWGRGGLDTEEKGFELGGDWTVPIERKNRQAYTVTSSNELRSSGCEPSSARLLWLSCDLILRPNVDGMSVDPWWNASFLSPLEFIQPWNVPQITIWLVCEPISRKENEVKTNKQTNKQKKEWNVFFFKRVIKK